LNEIANEIVNQSDRLVVPGSDIENMQQVDGKLERTPEDLSFVFPDAFAGMSIDMATRNDRS